MPTTTGLATSFINFSRASNATVSLSNGKIGWAGHNLLLASESFDSSSWTKTTTTVAANSHAAPNSTTTAETLTASSANGTTLQSYTALAVSYTFGVWLKRKTGTGNIQIAADSGTYTTVTITSDWALYTVTQTPAAGTISAGIRIVTSGDEVYAWGAHLYRSDMQMQLNPAMPAGMGSYYPTTPRNLLGYTEDFSNAYWTKSAVSIESDVGVAPNGLQTADKIVATGTSYCTVYRNAGTFVSGTKYTVSAYVKAGTKSFFQLGMFGLADAFFDLASLTYSFSGTGAVSASIADVGNGWRRVSATWTSASSYTTYFTIASSLSSVAGISVGDYVYLWGVQFSDSASLDTYVPVYGAAVTSAAYYAPRLDFDGATLSPRGLLVEEQRTNALTYSEDLSNAAWNTAAVTISANAGTAPDGATTADKMVGKSSYSGTSWVLQTETLSASTVYTASAFLKRAGVRYAYIGTDNASTKCVFFDLQAGTVGNSATGYTGSIVALGNDWYRCIVTINTSTASYAQQLLIGQTDTANSVTYTGNDVDGILVWGAQFETGSFATSYIPTGSATATRTADVASVSTQAFPYSATEGTIVASASFLSATAGSSGDYYFCLNDGTVSNRVLVAEVGSSSVGQVANAGSTTFQQSVGSRPPVNTPNKVAIAFATNNVNNASNGTIGTTSTTVSLPLSSVKTLTLGGRGDNAVPQLNGHLRQITYIPRRISNADLISRTA